MVELEGYVIILVEGRDGKIKLYGSPADRDGLEVADEILDVNERKLDDVPRALVIKHIHEVMRTFFVCVVYPLIIFYSCKSAHFSVYNHA